MIYAKVVGGGLNMRADTSIEAPRMTQIPSGSRIAVIERGTVWAKAIYNEFTGYVMVKYLQFEEEPSDEGVEVITLRIPKDVALSLFEALKTSLNT